MVGLFDSMTGLYTPPNNIVGIDDIFAQVKGFGGDATSPPLSWIDIHAQVPNLVIGIDDPVRKQS